MNRNIARANVIILFLSSTVHGENSQSDNEAWKRQVGGWHWILWSACILTYGLVLSSILYFSYKYIFRPWLACSNTKPEIPDPDVLEAQTFCLPFCKGLIGPWAPDYPRNVSDVDQNRFNSHPGLSPPPPPVTP
ncbi:hypothetical protein M405DRAFT_811009 [Rhizopogon salebrosus TDB-379]|nr:hypothetical protein M405DRAFT_811009 [Rhizopogon salebrosus TDB-379]